MSDGVWSIEENPNLDDLLVLSDGVIAYGRREAGVGEPLKIACLMREEGRVISGGSGRIEFQRLFIEYLWTSEEYRGKGLGTQALVQLQETAKKHGCRDVMIETLSDQNAKYYSRLGFKTIGQIKDYIPGFTKHTFLKPLTNALSL